MSNEHVRGTSTGPRYEATAPLPSEVKQKIEKRDADKGKRSK